ncbi:MAG: S8 family serine peptidase [Nocardioidaceae bacterium]
MTSRIAGSGTRRRAAVAFAAAAALLSGLLSTAPGALAGPVSGSTDKIEKKLSTAFDEDAEQNFWVKLNERADLTEASQIKDWNQRGEAVVKALKATAEKSQGDVRALLKSAGAEYKTYWATNAIRVTKGSESLAKDLMAQPEVEKLYAPRKYEVPETTENKPKMAPNALEWGIDNINANDVWEEFGATGQDIVIANIDTGVQYDHPALVDSYRGNLGGGTFDHNYNWYDVADNCSGAPCDTNGHGTHTMGTMAGDDGAGNQIGAAPGVKWIAANGCCPTDQALIDSGEWMLAPRDLNDQNADTSKRPHVINNSWGTIVPSNDPFMEDVLEDWEAAGIFGSWSNGNSGPNCATSGSPGSRTITYSAGAYDIGNNIASFSARGPGQDGTIKPNISAPGVNVRSSVPGNGYANFNGTSMAAPHLAGSVALLWSAAPSLLGDIAGTRALLDDTAVDKEDLQCGGTADDNNVYGEGRLDALALVQAAPTGEAGTLSGTVTDTATGDPLEGVTVAVTGAAERSRVTGADGTYSMTLPAGAYDLTATKFGYETATHTGITIVAGETTTQDVPMTPAESATVSGLVRDGSGHGWPLYATVAVDGTPIEVYTNPNNGRYSIDLPSGASYELTIESQYPGYTPATETVEVGNSDIAKDFSLTVDANECTAPGYQLNYDGLLENFDGTAAPEGWTVVDNIGNGQVWRFDNHGNRGNLTGGDGGFAIINSDAYGPSGRQDTSLVSPVFDLSGIESPTLEFATDYNDLGAEQADVDLSLDGGATWTNIWSQTTDLRGPTTVEVPVPAAANQSSVQLRWHYYIGTWDWWWEVDEAFIGTKSCDKIRGGLVWGNVTDFNTDDAVNGAKVTSVDVPADVGTSMATPDDANLADGFYWLFSSVTGTHEFTAEKGEYKPQTEDVAVQADWVREANFALRAGKLDVAPAEITKTVPMGQTRDSEFTVTNNGSAPATFELTERDRGFVILGADGTKTSSAKIATMEGAPLNRVKAEVSPLQSGSETAKNGVQADQGPQEEPWVNLTNHPTNIMDNAVGLNDGLVYSFGGTLAGSGPTASAFVYDPAALEWSSIADMPLGRQKPSAHFVDGKFYVVGGWGGGSGNTVAETAIYDPASDSWSAGADNPEPFAATGSALLDGKIYSVGGCAGTCGETTVTAYDVAGDSFEVLADYPEPTSWLACGGIDGKVYCGGGNGGAAGDASAYAYDPASDEWSPIASMPSDVWAAGYTAANEQLVVSGGVVGGLISNEGFVYDPATNEWSSDLPNSNNTLYRGGSTCGFYKVGGAVSNFNSTPLAEILPGYEDCGGAPADVPWLSEDPATATVAPGASVTVAVTLDATALAQPGAYKADIGIKEDTPYSNDPVAVTMDATPPRTWGKLMGTVSGLNGETVAPLNKATVQIDGAGGGSWTLVTPADGTYARWINRGQNPISMIAAKDGYAPQFRKTKIVAGESNVQDFLLRKAG